jgi:hypothetical protein
MAQTDTATQLKGLGEVLAGCANCCDGVLAQARSAGGEPGHHRPAAAGQRHLPQSGRGPPQRLSRSSRRIVGLARA